MFVLLGLKLGIFSPTRVLVPDEMSGVSKFIDLRERLIAVFIFVFSRLRARADETIPEFSSGFLSVADEFKL